MAVDRSHSGGHTSLSDRITDLSCACFAAWTVCAHAIVLTGGNLHDLLLAVGLVAATATAGAFAFWRVERRVDRQATERPNRQGGPSLETGVLLPSSVDDGLPRAIRLAAAAFALVALAAYVATDDVFLLWWGGLAVLAAASAQQIIQPGPRFESPQTNRAQEVTLWLVAIGCGVLSLVSHRYAVDDSFYVSVAAAAADHPIWPLLSWDPLHDPAFPLHNPIHRIHSYELLAGAFSYLTQIPAIYVFHWGMAGFVGMLVPLSYARLLRLLVPSAWLPAVIVVVVYLIANGDTHRSYGNYSFVRIWHGKAFMLHALLPLVYAYALQFTSKSSLRTWAMLGAVQIAAVGASSSALWLAPLSAGLALVAGSGIRPLGIRTIVLGVLASSYPVAIGFGLKSTMVATTSRFIDEAEAGEPLQSALTDILGLGAFEVLGLAAALLASLAVRGAPARRFAAIVTLGAWFAILSPYWETFTRANITGPSFWRSLWALPVPILVALLFTAPLQWATRRRATAGALVAVALAALVVFVPDRTTLRSGTSFKERVWIGWPEAKVDRKGYDCARLLNKHSDPGQIVIAPERVSQWVPTFHHPAQPILVRRIYLRLHSERLGAEEHLRREQVTRFISGAAKGRKAGRQFARALEDYQAAAVCLPQKINNGARRILANSGYRKVDHTQLYELWVHGKS